MRMRKLESKNIVKVRLILRKLKNMKKSKRI